MYFICGLLAGLIAYWLAGYTGIAIAVITEVLVSITNSLVKRMP